MKMTQIVQIVHDYLTGFETLLAKESMQKLENLERNQAVEDAQLILLKKMEKVVGHLHWDQKKKVIKSCVIHSHAQFSSSRIFLDKSYAYSLYPTTTTTRH